MFNLFKLFYVRINYSQHKASYKGGGKFTYRWIKRLFAFHVTRSAMV